MPLRLATLLWAASALAGCSTAWEDASPKDSVVRADELKTILDQATTWKGVLPAPARERDRVEGRWHLAADDAFQTSPGGPPVVPVEPAAAPVVAPPPMRAPKPAPRPAPTLPVPQRRATPPKPKRGTPINKSPKELVRAHYLDNPTTVRAAKITFYCPLAYLPEVRLKAEEVTNTSADRRVAMGAARLTCRELTLIAEQITLRIRRTDDAELQITARGDVELVTRVRNKATRETGLRSLILRQDGMMPIR